MVEVSRCSLALSSSLELVSDGDTSQSVSPEKSIKPQHG